MKKKKKNLIIILFILLILGIFAFYKILGKTKNNILIDKNAKDYKVEIELPESHDESKILVPGFSDINVEQNYTKKGMQLFNPEKNDVYFKYELTIKETNKTIYTTETDLIPPGKSVEIFPWENIPKGSYNLIVNIKTYSIENPEEELNGANVVIKMNIS